MQVIKKGRPQKGWAKKFECTGRGNGNGGCEAILLVEQDDVFRTQSHALNETTDYATFRCVECGVWTDIPEPPFTPRPKRSTDCRGIVGHISY